jgi:hypothetical protein
MSNITTRLVRDCAEHTRFSSPGCPSAPLPLYACGVMESAANPPYLPTIRALRIPAACCNRPFEGSWAAFCVCLGLGEPVALVGNSGNGPATLEYHR